MSTKSIEVKVLPTLDVTQLPDRAVLYEYLDYVAEDNSAREAMMLPLLCVWIANREHLLSHMESCSCESCHILASLIRTCMQLRDAVTNQGEETIH